MIGYYIHHVGRGHLHRALAIVRSLGEPVTALSSLPPAPDWPGPWVSLPRDDRQSAATDPTAGGTLHWAPMHDDGLRARMAALAAWIAAARPRLVVVDLSVEVVVLCRLLGVPAVAVTLPGVRDDAAHALGYDLAEAILAPFPADLPRLGISLRRWQHKTFHSGAISRFDGRTCTGATSSGAQVLVLGGGGPSTRPRPRAGQLSAWSVETLDGAGWVDDPWPRLCAADVIVTHAGLGALADVAASRRPAVVLPEQRPHQEQTTTAAALAAAGIAIVPDGDPTPRAWPALLDAARERGGQRWGLWSPGDGAERAAAFLRNCRHG